MKHKITALAVHLFTAIGAILAFWAIILIMRGDAGGSLLVLALAAVVDSVDGTLARRAEVKTHAPHIDGALLDNIVDYLSWVFLPVIWALIFLDVPFWAGSIVLVASLFGFSNTQAKTGDNFFMGFPSYWNVVILYLYVLGAGSMISTLVMLALAVLVFSPIKFIYPSRTAKWQKATLLLSVPYGLLLLVMLIYLQQTPHWITLLSFYYPIYYVGISVMFTRHA